MLLKEFGVIVSGHIGDEYIIKDGDGIINNDIIERIQLEADSLQIVGLNGSVDWFRNNVKRVDRVSHTSYNVVFEDESIITVILCTDDEEFYSDEDEFEYVMPCDIKGYCMPHCSMYYTGKCR